MTCTRGADVIEGKSMESRENHLEDLPCTPKPPIEQKSSPSTQSGSAPRNSSLSRLHRRFRIGESNKDNVCSEGVGGKMTEVPRAHLEAGINGSQAARWQGGNATKFQKRESARTCSELHFMRGEIRH